MKFISNPKITIILAILGLSFLFCWSSAQAQTIYVTDYFKITLRSGPNTSKRIIRMLPSNTPLQVLEEKKGWLKVRTQKGREGWVLKRFTMQETPKKFIIENLRDKNEELEEQVKNISSKASSLEKENSELKSSLKETRAELEKLTQKYEKLREDAGSVLTLKKKFEQTKAELKNATQKLENLSKENKMLRASTSRDWFIAGAVVVGISALLGFIIGRIQKKRSRKLYL